MTTRRLTVWLVVTGLVAILAMLALHAAVAQYAGQLDRRLAADSGRGSAVADLISDVHRYDQRIVSVLLLGSGNGQLDALGDARILFERDFALLDRATRNEIETLSSVEDVAGQLPQVDTTRRATELYHAIDGATNSMLQQVRSGHLDDARQLYLTQIRFRLANELEMTTAIGRCLSRHRKDYAALSATPDRFDDFAAAVGRMQSTQPNWSAAMLAQLAVPVAVVQAERDEFIRREHAEYLAHTIPGASFTLLEGVSHFAPLQRPELFNSAIMSFLAPLRF